MKLMQSRDGTWHAVVAYAGRTFLGYGATRREARDFCLELIGAAR